jgi:hypothetical protein
MPSVCIVIPHHRAVLKPTERCALDHCVQLLGHYHVALVSPQALDVSSLLADYPELACERFEDASFGSVADYNRLMLSDHFYARFADFDYLLLHQLDAFVFADRLADWCNRGYDYVGAPWLRGTAPKDGFNRLRRRLKAGLYRALDRREASGVLHYSQFDGAVGNGGFSLRRVAALRRVLARFDGHPRLERYRSNADHLDNHTANEDLFFGIEVNRYRRHLRVPRTAVAAAFAWESQPEQARALAAAMASTGCIRSSGRHCLPYTGSISPP